MLVAVLPLGPSELVRDSDEADAVQVPLTVTLQWGNRGRRNLELYPPPPPPPAYSFLPSQFILLSFYSETCPSKDCEMSVNCEKTLTCD